VEIRDGRATVSGESLSVTAGNGGKTASTTARIRESGYCRRTFSAPPRVKGRYDNMRPSRVARCVSAAAFLVLLPPCAAQAATGTPSPSPAPAASPSSPLPQIGRVVTSDRRSEPIGATSRPTFVVDRKRIESYGARTVADALQDVPGLNLFSYGPFGSLTEYGIRGALSAQTLVLVDGAPITDASTGTVELGQLSTIGVDRIEVVEGGASTLYGTSASGGVINVITSAPRGTYLAVSDGSYADRDVRVGAGNGIVGLSYEKHVANNAYAYPPLNYSSKVMFLGGVRPNAYGDQSAGRLSLDLPVAKTYHIRARLDDAETQIGVPGDLAFGATPDGSQGTGFQRAFFELDRDEAAAATSVTFSAVRNRLDFYEPTQSNGESDVYTARSQLSLKQTFSASHLDGVGGIDLSRETGLFSFPTAPALGTSPAVPAFATSSAQAQSAAYVQLGTSPRAGTRFTAGLRAENDSPHGSVLAPSFGGVIRSGALRFAGNVGESFRIPTLDDLYYPNFGNPNLLPEKAQTADVTVAYEAPHGSLSVGWFDRNGSNFIITDPVTFLPGNAQNAATAGVTVTASTRPFAGLTAQASFTDLYRALNVLTGARLPRNPSGTATLSIAHEFTSADRFAYGLRWAIVGSDGEDKTYAGPQLATSYDAYDTLDAFVRYRIAPQGIITVRGFNLGDERYVPIFGYPAIGRRLYVELSSR